jgi:hypothetical protein
MLQRSGSKRLSSLLPLKVRALKTSFDHAGTILGAIAMEAAFQEVYLQKNMLLLRKRL